MTTTYPTPIAPSPRPPRSAGPMRGWVVPITIEQYLRMIEQGIVPEDNTIELLRGLLVRKDRSAPGEDPMGHGPQHLMAVSLLVRLAKKIDADRHYLNVQLPVACPPDGAPEPDASIVRGTPRDYPNGMPTAADVSCVIEVAHSSLEHDREDKLPIYAEAGIGQYVLVNLINNTVEVYSDPDRATQQYRAKATLERGGRIPLQLPDGQVLEIDVAEVLP